MGVAERVDTLVRPIITDMGYELVDVAYVKEGRTWYLRVFIDQPDGVGIDDCEQVSRSIEPVLDAEDFIPHSYHLEVSSPGLERPLKKDADFGRFAGNRIKVTTFVPIEGKKEFTGSLLGLEEGAVALDLGAGKVLRIKRSELASAHLVAEFS